VSAGADRDASTTAEIPLDQLQIALILVRTMTDTELAVHVTSDRKHATCPTPKTRQSCADKRFYARS